jgi:hypothetical protein
MLQGQAERIWAVMLIGLMRQTQLFSYFGVICRWGHQIKACPAVAFPCCLDKESETRSAQYARCNVGSNFRLNSKKFSRILKKCGTIREIRDT